MLKFSRLYFFSAVILFGIEVLIALFVHDRIIRPYIGDLLVVVLIYCFIKSFLDIPVFKAALFVLLFSYVIEILQYFNLVEKLGLQHSKIASTVIGTSFAWLDLLAYTAGIALVVFIEKVRG